MTGNKQWTGSKHYEDMDVQPFEVFASMHMLWEYTLTAAVKYIMRIPTHGAEELTYTLAHPKRREDLVKAIHCLQTALKVLDENS